MNDPVTARVTVTTSQRREPLTWQARLGGTRRGKAGHRTAGVARHGKASRG